MNGFRGVGLTWWRCAFWSYAVLWTGLLLVPHPEDLPFIRSAVPQAIRNGEHEWDKVVHATGYLGLALVTMVAYGPGTWTWQMAGLLAAVAVHGAGTEIAQHWVPSRHCDLFDWLADVGGVALALCLWSAVARLRGARRDDLTPSLFD